MAAVAALVLLGGLGYVLFRHVQPLLAGSGCEVDLAGTMPLVARHGLAF